MFDYSPPEVNPGIGRIDYFWSAMELLVIADRISDAGSAELWFYHRNGKTQSLLHTAKVNLLSTATMTQVAKRMKEHSADVPWREVLTCISSSTMEIQRRSEPGAILKPFSAERLKPQYYIEPLLMKRVTNIIFGEKGSNKTTLALTILGLLTIGVSEPNDSPSGLVASAPARSGILDWEGTEDLTNYTLARLVEGQTIPYIELPYLHCRQKLTDDIEHIANFVLDKKLEVVLIDSLGAAAGSDKFDSAGKGAALNFFEALRLLNVTSLVIGQTAKNEEGKKTIYGSTYFTYYSRNIFEVKKIREVKDGNDLHIAVIHTESNYSRKYKPLGFHLNYTDTTILVEAEEVTYSDLKERVKSDDLIIEFLELENKLCSVRSIAEAIEKSDNATRVLLSRLKTKDKVVNPSTGLWGLPVHN